MSWLVMNFMGLTFEYIFVCQGDGFENGSSGEISDDNLVDSRFNSQRIAINSPSVTSSGALWSNSSRYIFT